LGFAHPVNVLEKVQETSGDVLAQLLLEGLIVLQRGKAKKSLARPKRRAVMPHIVSGGVELDLGG
jgi:hypothetical protein